jgi:hypothetical protein
MIACDSLKEGLGFTVRAKPKARGANRVESLKAFMVAFKWGHWQPNCVSEGEASVSIDRREGAR